MTDTTESTGSRGASERASGRTTGKNGRAEWSIGSSMRAGSQSRIREVSLARANSITVRPAVRSGVHGLGSRLPNDLVADSYSYSGRPLRLSCPRCVRRYCSSPRVYKLTSSPRSNQFFSNSP
jgi:hypothetical protein